MKCFRVESELLEYHSVDHGWQEFREIALIWAKDKDTATELLEIALPKIRNAQHEPDDMDDYVRAHRLSPRDGEKVRRLHERLELIESRLGSVSVDAYMIRHQGGNPIGPVVLQASESERRRVFFLELDPEALAETVIGDATNTILDRF